MRHDERTRRAIGAALAVALLGGGALWAASAAGDAGVEEKTRVRLILDRDGAGDRIAIDDLGELAIGESRTYTTDGGQAVVATRDEKGYELDVDGKKMRIRAPGEGGEFDWHAKQVELEAGAGDGKTMVFVTSDHETSDGVRIVRRGGPGGAHAFAFGAPMPLLAVEATIERLEANEKFRSLDAATRATVLEALRESMPKPLVGELDGEGGHAERVIVFDVREEGGKDDATE